MEDIFDLSISKKESEFVAHQAKIVSYPKMDEEDMQMPMAAEDIKSLINDVTFPSFPYYSNRVRQRNKDNRKNVIEIK